LRAALPRVLTLMSGESLSEQSLDVWLAMSNKDRPNIGTFRLLSTMLRLIDKKVVAANMQLATRRPILDNIWKGATSDDRKIRVVAG
jgi:hypothetical protein